jgi:iron complex outermembrane recepter protein
MKINRHVSFSLIAVAFSVGGEAWASDQAGQIAATSNATDPAALQEIVVTAQFRREDIQDVPLSVTAFDTAALEAMGANDFADYARAVPGLSFADRGPNRGDIIIRGISPVTGESAVGLYLDGVPQSNSFNNPDYQLFDVERVEVLRGPQGTLYGEASLGGTIKILTNKPDPSAFESKVELTGSDTDHGGFNSGVNALVNIPLSGQAALRVSGFDHDDSGWIDNAFNGAKDINDWHSVGGRAALLFRPFEGLDLQAIVNYQRDAVGALNVQTSAPPSAFGLPAGTAPFAPYQVYSPLQDDEAQRNTQYTLLGDYRFASGSIESVFGYNDEQDVRAIDSVTAGLPPGLPTFFDSHSITKLAELRYLSDLGGNFDYVVGLFGRDRSRDSILTLVDGGPLFFGVPGNYVNSADFQTKTAAAYGEAYYRAGPWTGTLGVRLSSEEVATPSLTTIGTLVASNVSPDSRYRSATPKFGLSYAQSKDLLLFANIAQGFRSGGNNPFPATDPNYVAAYKPDSAWSYEFGVKSEAFDRRLTMNATAYYINWKNLQILGVPANPSLGFTTNAGAAHSTGFEAELKARPISSLELSLGTSYTEAELDEAAQGAPAGTSLQLVPKWNFNAAAEYRHPITTRVTGFIRADWSERTPTNSSLPPDPLTAIPTYDMVNLRLGVDLERISFAVFANNLTNNLGITDSAASGQYMSRPRTVGLNIKAKL